MAVTKIEHEPFPMELIGDPSTALIKPKSDASENYKLYRKHKVEIFNMIYDLWSSAPHISLFELTEEEKEENKQYYESKKPELIKHFKEMGFGGLEYDT